MKTGFYLILILRIRLWKQFLRCQIADLETSLDLQKRTVAERETTINLWNLDNKLYFSNRLIESLRNYQKDEGAAVASDICHCFFWKSQRKSEFEIFWKEKIERNNGKIKKDREIQRLRTEISRMENKMMFNEQSNHSFGDLCSYLHFSCQLWLRPYLQLWPRPYLDCLSCSHDPTFSCGHNPTLQL